MRHLLAALFAVLALGSPALADVERPALAVHVTRCSTGQDASDRVAVFTGSMPAVAGTDRMQMRFDLYQRRAGARGFAKVALPKWGQWERSSQSDVPGFIFVKRVEQLAAPADYRAVVHFRWLAADGDVVRSSRRTSAVCRQPDPRPDLQVGAVTLAPDGSYAVAVGNGGRGDAGPFAVAVTAGGTTGTAQVGGLAAGQSTTVDVAAGACGPGELVSVAVDPADAVDESHEGDDAVRRPCPVPTRR